MPPLSYYAVDTFYPWAQDRDVAEQKVEIVPNSTRKSQEETNYLRLSRALLLKPEMCSSDMGERGEE